MVVFLPGFGQVVPITTAGRAVIIVYGLFGCSAVILFYNLFLERIITLLALVLRSIHEYKMRKKSKQYNTYLISKRHDTWKFGLVMAGRNQVQKPGPWLKYAKSMKKP